MNKLSTADRVRVVAALVEGNSINSTVRMTGVSKPTILKLLTELGTACQTLHDNRVVGLKTKRAQADEIWSFCHSRAANVRPENKGKDGHGDTWCWTAIDADNKLIITWHVGQRTLKDAVAFMNDVAGRLANKIQLTTDGLGLYIDGVLAAFDDVDFGQLIKTYGKNPDEKMGRFNPSVCTGAIPTPRFGNPDMDHISTSFVERSNLTMRMGMRRFTR